MSSLIDKIDDVLPQTQCSQCGYAGCRAYAWAIVMDEAPINRCAPGGKKGIEALAQVTGRDVIELDPEYGHEVPLEVSHIKPELCIGCRKCVAVCPTNAIVGAPKRMHAVITDWCTGCALCVVPCPVDCVEMVPATFEWTTERAHAARDRYKAKQHREKLKREAHDKRMAAETTQEKKKNLIADILKRAQKKMNKDKRYEIMKRLAAERPEPKSELNYTTPYELVVAVALSAQATDKSVNLATEKLFPVANTPKAMVALGVDGLIPYIKTIGLYRNKAKNVIALSQKLLDDFGGEVPCDREGLESLPGVGRKTANVVLNVAFGLPTIAVDTHIFRVSNRTGFALGKTPEEVEQKLLKFMPKEFMKDSHHWLLLHGRYCCKAINPDCPHCPISDLCEFKKKSQ